MDVRAFLEGEVKPALGCTEPAAVALAVAAARARLSQPVSHIHLRLSANLYKNGLNVGVPGALGLRGTLIAAALGAVAGDPGKGLLVLEGVSEADAATARRLLEREGVTQEVVQDVPTIYAEAELSARGESSSAVVAGRHDQVVEVRHHGKAVFEAEDRGAASGTPPPYVKDLLRLSFAQMWELAGSIGPDTAAFMLEGARMNMEAARAGLSRPMGLGTGFALARDGDRGLLSRVRVHASAAADARMDGARLPVMSSAGSGNHGLCAVIPAVLCASEWGVDEAGLAQALALSHLVTGFVKAKTGRLTPICGCAVAAGAGAAASIARLGGGTPEQAEYAVANVLSALLGMVCDGGKPSCAFKVGSAASEAYCAAVMALAGAHPTDQQGVIGPSFAQNATAVGEVSQIGMAGVEQVILRLLQRFEETGRPDGV